MTDLCESCGLPKRTLEQVNDHQPHPGTCTTWLLARFVDDGAKVAGCEIEAYRKLVAAQAELTAYRKLEEQADAMRARLHAVDGSGEATIYYAAAKAELRKVREGR